MRKTLLMWLAWSTLASAAIPAAPGNVTVSLPRQPAVVALNHRQWVATVDANLGNGFLGESSNQPLSRGEAAGWAALAIVFGLFITMLAWAGGGFRPKETLISNGEETDLFLFSPVLGPRRGRK